MSVIILENSHGIGACGSVYEGRAVLWQRGAIRNTLTPAAAAAL